MNKCEWCEEEYREGETTIVDGDKVCIYCESGYKAHQHRDAVKIAI